MKMVKPVGNDMLRVTYLLVVWLKPSKRAAILEIGLLISVNITLYQEMSATS